MSSVAKKGGLGLDDIGDLSALLDAESADGKPLEILLDLIDEDPNQPRTEFNQEKLEEMAGTIRLGKVKTPISVRSNPFAPGRFIINHGARRYRASILAGKESIPAHIDDNYSVDDVYRKFDQAIENLHREDLTSLEIARIINEAIADIGMKKNEVAKALGKSSAFITQHIALLALPDPIAEVFNSGRCKDVTVINELVTAYKKNPDEITEFLTDDKEITRGTVKVLRNSLESGEPGASDAEQGNNDGKTPKKTKGASPTPAPDKIKKGIVLVDYNGRPARLLLTKRPTSEDTGWILFDIDGTEEEVALGKLSIVAVMEG